MTTTGLTDAGPTPQRDHPLSFIGHELRTPIAGIIGLATTLLDTPLDGTQRELIRTIQAAGEHVSALLDREIPRRAMLVKDRDDPGTLSFDPAMLAATVGRLLAPQASAKGIELAVHPHRLLPAGVLGDPVAVRQVLVNLVANAVRETSSGGVTIRVRAERAGTGIRFEVADTGDGMPEFARLRLQGIVAPGSEGLGLGICHDLVTRMGGAIEVTETDGPGTLVWFSLPLEAVADRPVRDEAPTNAARVLLASDDVVNTQVSLALLHRLGYAVEVVSSGIEALRAWRTSRFDLCIIDQQLPQFDGAEVATCIRRLERSSGEAIALVGLTAGSTAADRASCLEAGMDATLAKPLDLGALVEVLARYAPPRPGVEIVTSIEAVEVL